MSNFATFATFAALVHEQFNRMSQHELFVTASGDEMWDAYLAAFPDGTNPMYRERTEHDCSCCRNFIKNIGNVVALIDGQPISIWDVENAPHPYDTVATALGDLARSHGITNIFRTKEGRFGAEHNFERLDDGSVKQWHHFWGEVQARHRSDTPDKDRGEYRTRVQTLKRGLEELKPDALDTVRELIESKALYRGEEHLHAVKAFHQTQHMYLTMSEWERHLSLWINANASAAHFRNSVIGTLVQDLSDGKDVEYAVKSFETKVAPANYKRPTAIITQGMVDQAMKTIGSLGLEPALARRQARLTDVNVVDVLWASNKAKSKMVGGVGGLLAASVKTKAPTKAEDISIDDFIAKVMPKVKDMAVFVKNKHRSNLMVLTAPVEPEAPRLFKWDNGFAWSYSGNVADSIKERVKNAGGKVEGDLCCRLAWDYRDDLDFHMLEPKGGHIYFGNRRRLSACGGELDLDANGADGLTAEPAENIVYGDQRRMKEGMYELLVHNYSRRSNGKGFKVEIEFAGQIYEIECDKVVPQNAKISVAKLRYSKAKGIELIESLPSHASSQQLWNINTESFVDVSTVMLSPNHWGDSAVGNKHFFFVLDGCRTDESMRGIYNEFLRSDLDPHRRVFEVLGTKTKCEPDQDGMAGLGFSSTRSDEVIVRCDDRLFNIKF
jgi:hypothetical protein